MRILDEFFPFLLAVACYFCGMNATTPVIAAEEYPLYVGWASADITPEKPVALVGQMSKRIARSTLDPLTATVLALETRRSDGEKEQAIMISCDVLYIGKAVQERLRNLVKPELPDFDINRLFMNATHTHTGPGFIDGAFGGLYDVSQDEGVMKASEYAEFFLERVAGAVVKAWQDRKPGGVSWGAGGRRDRAESKSALFRWLFRDVRPDKSRGFRRHRRL